MARKRKAKKRKTKKTRVQTRRNPKGRPQGAYVPGWYWSEINCVGANSNCSLDTGEDEDMNETVVFRLSDGDMKLEMYPAEALRLFTGLADAVAEQAIKDWHE